MAVVLPELGAVAAAEVLVIHELHSAFSDQIALLQILVLRQLSLGEFTEEADDVRAQRAVRVIAPLHGLDVELRKRE